MKKTKVVLAMVCAVLLVAASVMGTLAYLTSTSDTVTNTFNVGAGVKITLDEAKVDTLGVKETTAETDDDGNHKLANRVTENSYKLIPGHTYVKDPIVHVASDSEDCFLFVQVVNEINAIESAKTIATQMSEKGWIAVAGVNNVYVYVGTDAGATAPKAVSAGTDVSVFDTITINNEQTSNTLTSYANKTVKIYAYAVQKDGLTDKTTGKALWDAVGFTVASTTPAT